ncbi:MAG: BREX system ATP-binding protein BrxD [Myxococcales bacterium]|nr:BREX system ATP-binding protein BrxD [Myxococcales bacterium]
MTSQRDTLHIFEKLRGGAVPERAIESFAVGIEPQRDEIKRQLELLRSGEGAVKFLRGGYGCGKTFMARLALLDAQAQGFATSFVVVSDNDLHFHRFDDVYRKVMTELGTAECQRGALGDILDRFIAKQEGALIELGHDPDTADFDAKVRDALRSSLASATDGKAPPDFARVVQTIFDLKQKNELQEAGALISWLCGSTNVAAGTKKLAGIKGEITGTDALAYLRGVLEIVRAADYHGLVIVIDEAETILRMRKDSRHKSLNGIRQIFDAAGSYPGLLWIFTGTPDFFDSRQGVAGLAPLHDRICFKKTGRFASLRQAQLELTPFDQARLISVATCLHDRYPARDRDRLTSRVSRPFIERLVADVTAGFKGDVGVVPRQFLREFVTQMDLVDEQPDYDPMQEYSFKIADLTPQEQHKLTGKPLLIADDAADEPVLKEDVW